MHKILTAIIMLLLLTGCMSSQDRFYKKLSKEDSKNTKYRGHYKIGKEYNIKGEKYVPAEDINYKQVGIASWYGSECKFHGSNTANGDRYNKLMLTAAHPTLPLPSLVKVTNLSNNKSVILMVNDRGPFCSNRIIDVSERAAQILSFKLQGTAKVEVQYLHQETKNFLKQIVLIPKEGARVKKGTKARKNPYCSVNCHIKLVNLKYKLNIEP